MKHLIDISCAGLNFSCALRYAETADYFPAAFAAATCGAGEAVCLTDEDWRYYLKTGMEDCAHTEFSLLTAAFSDALMNHERIILHAVAIRWRDRAYLIAARSGTGKSTQTRCLQELRPGEFSVICGDRPILQFCHSERSAAESKNPSPFSHSERSAAESKNPLSVGAVIGRPPEAAVLVHPSPWNGKENWHGAEAAPLAGVILLERGDENRLVTLSPREAAIRCYAQVIQLCRDPEKMRKAAELVTLMLKSVPIWQLSSFQVPDSTKLLLEAVFPPETTAL